MIFNGTKATITRIDQDRRRIEAIDAHHRPLVIPFAYAEAGYLTWGYATTLHKAQGATLEIRGIATRGGLGQGSGIR